MIKLLSSLTAVQHCPRRTRRDKEEKEGKMGRKEGRRERRKGGRKCEMRKIKNGKAR